MDFFDYYAALLARAWDRTCAVIPGKTKTDAVRDSIIFVLGLLALYTFRDELIARHFMEKTDSIIADDVILTMIWLLIVIFIFSTLFVVEALVITPFFLVREAQQVLPIPVHRQHWLARKLAVPADTECPHFGIGSAGDERSEMIRYALTRALTDAGWVKTPPGPTTLTTDREAAHIHVPAEAGVEAYIFVPPAPSKEVISHATTIVQFLRMVGITAKMDRHDMMKQASAADHIEINIGRRAKYP